MPDTNEKDKKTEKGSTILPKTDFSMLVLSLNSSALVYLGAENDPATGSRSVNINLAKQTIDILAMLAEKTKGNLEKDEERLLTNVLYELRLLYVKEKKESKSS